MKLVFFCDDAWFTVSWNITTVTHIGVTEIHMQFVTLSLHHLEVW
jgi:hypothetical protein